MPVEGFEDAAWRAGQTLAAAVAAYAVAAWAVAPALSRAVVARNPRNRTLVNAVRTYVRALGVAVAVVVAILTAGYGYVLGDSAIVVAAATLAIGVAGQEVFGNVVSGLFLVADRNFNVGNWVSWGGETGGVVEVVGFRSTRVRTTANELVTVPNTELATQAVHNPYARGRYRTSVAVGVPYDADLDVAEAAMMDGAAAVEDVVESPPPEVVASFADDAITLELYVWMRDVKHPDIRRVQSSLTRRVRDALVAAGVDASPAAQRELSGHLTLGFEDA
ncbi:mechanosensitive ion channel family protein [Halobacterium zhouii]|uniref:mechanosensitive ion channel family protein n=1 Tax=Halobacterium zhouii TaxID=2902624 RepID=UPI001E301C3A|nr:mechanosensitive ion channel family protein [Halobacterium zhouii]